MKQLALLCVALIVFSGLSVAQDNNKTQSGSLGWMFSLSGLSNLGAGNYNGGVGMKYYFQDNCALRGGVGFSKTDIPNQDNDPSSFEINGGLQYNYSSSGPVVGYFGGMVLFGSEKQTGQTESSTLFGIAALAGAEWFPWNSVSLGAEYQLAFTSAKAAGSSDNVTSIDIASASGANLTLTLYVK